MSLLGLQDTPSAVRDRALQDQVSDARWIVVGKLVEPVGMDAGGLGGHHACDGP